MTAETSSTPNFELRLRPLRPVFLAAEVEKWPKKAFLAMLARPLLRNGVVRAHECTTILDGMGEDVERVVHSARFGRNPRGRTPSKSA